MALFIVYGTRKVIVYEDCRVEVEADDEAGAVAAADSLDVDGDIDWNSDPNETQPAGEDPAWTVTPLPPGAGVER